MKAKRQSRSRQGTAGSLGLWATSVVLVVGGCAQPPAQRIASRSSEYFPSSVYGPASPRVVGEGEAVPRGGGQYLVGRPYSVAGHRYYPSESGQQTQVGMASYYGAAFHGRRTANGEVFDMASISAAHPTMPLPSYARVTNLSNGRSIIVRVNDRGPYHGGRVMDLSQRAAELLDYRRIGTTRVQVDYVGRAQLDGSDDAVLMASLRTDGQPAALPGSAPSPRQTMVASAAPQLPPAPPPLPRPVPQRVALLEPMASAAADEAPSVTVISSRSVALPANPPVPPSRPFNLGVVAAAETQVVSRGAGANFSTLARSVRQPAGSDPIAARLRAEAR